MHLVVDGSGQDICALHVDGVGGVFDKSFIRGTFGDIGYKFAVDDNVTLETAVLVYDCSVEENEVMFHGRITIVLCCPGVFLEQA